MSKLDISNEADNTDNLNKRFIFVYQDDNYVSILEKKYNRLLGVKIEPHIEVVMIQYYLLVLGGNHNNPGLIKSCSKLLLRVNNDISLYKINNMKSNIIETMHGHEKRLNKLHIDMLEKYTGYLDTSKTETESLKYDLYYLHKLQIITQETSKNDMKKISNHIKDLNMASDKLNESISENNKLLLDNIIVKFVESQIGVIDQQLELLSYDNSDRT